jgi:hypothetical protein
MTWLPFSLRRFRLLSANALDGLGLIGLGARGSRPKNENFREILVLAGDRKGRENRERRESRREEARSKQQLSIFNIQHTTQSQSQ